MRLATMLSVVLAALRWPSCRCRCRSIGLHERPIQRCVVYRHKEELPEDAAPFFDLYLDGQQPDTFMEARLDKPLPFRAPLFEAETVNKLTLEHQICLAAASDTCSFLAPFGSSGSSPAVHAGVSPGTERDRAYLPDVGILQGRGPLYTERSPTFSTHPPFTGYEEEHADGFWTDFAYKAKVQDGTGAGPPRDHPWGQGRLRSEANELEPFSLRGADDFDEPADFKNTRTSGLDKIGLSSVSCQDECEWLRGKIPRLWMETADGKDEECTAAHVWFDNGCWYDGTPAQQLEHHEQRPVTQFQRQKLAAMFSACDWAGVARTPQWVLRELQDIMAKPGDDKEHGRALELLMPKPFIPWRAESYQPNVALANGGKAPHHEGFELSMPLQLDATRYDLAVQKEAMKPPPPSPPPPPPPYPPPKVAPLMVTKLSLYLDFDSKDIAAPSLSNELVKTCSTLVNYDFPGHDREWPTLRTREECNQRCVNTAWCMAYAFDERAWGSRGRCWLKTTSTSMRHYPGIVTGRCVKEQTTQSRRWIDNSGYGYDGEIRAVARRKTADEIWVRPVRGTQAIESPINMGAEIDMEFEMKVEDTVYGWSNIFHAGASLLEMQPSIYLHHRSGALHVCLGSTCVNGNEKYSEDRSVRHVQIKVQDGRLVLFENGEDSDAAEVGSNAVVPGQKAFYLSNPWFPSAHVMVRRLTVGGASVKLQPPTNNEVLHHAPGVGGWGGSCTCPDGQIYQAGDWYDHCRSLACVGGTSGPCQRHNGPWSRTKVTCDPSNVAWFTEGPQVMTQGGLSYLHFEKNGYVAIRNAHFSGGIRISSMSAEVWFRTTFNRASPGQRRGWTTWSDNWSFLDFDRSENFNFFLRSDDGRLHVGTPGDNGYDYYEVEGRPLNDGKWHHAAFTLAPGGQLSIFRDGLPSRMNAQPGREPGGGSSRYGFIGDGSEASSFDGTRNNIGYTGDIAMVRLHGGTLTPFQVRSNFLLTRCTYTTEIECGQEVMVPGQAFVGGQTPADVPATAAAEGAGGILADLSASAAAAPEEPVPEFFNSPREMSCTRVTLWSSLHSSSPEGWARVAEVANSVEGVRNCGAICRERGFQYFGLQCPNTLVSCQCSNHLAAGVAEEDSECDHDDDPADTSCGGPYVQGAYLLGSKSFGSVYSTAPGVATFRHPPVASGSAVWKCKTGGDWTQMPQEVANSFDGAESCGHECKSKGYSFFSLECPRANAVVCACAHGLDGSTKVPESECNHKKESGTCTGPFVHSPYLMGSYGAAAVYATDSGGSGEGPTQGIYGSPTEMSCMRVTDWDPRTGWTRPAGDVATSVSGVEDCAMKCRERGYKYFGLECPRPTGVHCQCANQLINGNELDASECRSQASHSSQCPGPYTIGTYMLGAADTAAVYETAPRAHRTSSRSSPAPSENGNVIREITRDCVGYGSDEEFAFQIECVAACNDDHTCAGATLRHCVAGPPEDPPKEDRVVENAPGVGGWGGQCTCPDGSVYYVGDYIDHCATLACEGGASGTCIQHSGRWSRRKVICHDPFGTHRARCTLIRGHPNQHLQQRSESHPDSWGYAKKEWQPPPPPPQGAGSSKVVAGCTKAVTPQQGKVICLLGSTIKKVNFASYGTPWGDCGAMQRSWCHAEDSEAYVRRMCMGRQTCELGMFNHLLGDPCPGWSKWMQVDVECENEIFEIAACVDSASEEHRFPPEEEDVYASYMLCQQACQARDGCVGFTWSMDGGCTTHLACAQRQPAPAGSGAVSIARKRHSVNGASSRSATQLLSLVGPQSPSERDRASRPDPAVALLPFVSPLAFPPTRRRLNGSTAVSDSSGPVDLDDSRDAFHMPANLPRNRENAPAGLHASDEPLDWATADELLQSFPASPAAQQGHAVDAVVGNQRPRTRLQPLSARTVSNRTRNERGELEPGNLSRGRAARALPMPNSRRASQRRRRLAHRDNSSKSAAAAPSPKIKGR